MGNELEVGRRSVIQWVDSKTTEEEKRDFELAPDKYSIDAEIGKGGMGEVMLVTDRDLRRQVAMKIIRPDVAESRDLLMHFVAEAQATSQLEHPGIPPVHDIGFTSDNQIYFTMKLVRGQSMRDVIQDLVVKRRGVQEEFNLHRLISMLQQIAETLHFAHERGVLHRDIKPDNVMLGDYGEVHVVDWGLARVTGQAEETPTIEELEKVTTARTAAGMETQYGVVKGTLLYMSPEQALGETETLDRRADIFSLGCLLYEVLCLKPPYDATDPEVYQKIATADVKPVEEMNPRRRVPPTLADICRKSMARERDERYQTSREMAVEFRRWLDGRAERERRHKEAEELTAQGNEAIERHRKLQRQVKEAEKAASEEAKKYKAWQPVTEKLSLIEARRTAVDLRTGVGLAFAESLKLLQAALIAEPENLKAKAALASIWKSQLVEAERKRDKAETAYALANLERYDDEIKSEGKLSLQSLPSEAEILLYRFVEHEGLLVPEEKKVLGKTPLKTISLPMGSYLCVLQAEGYLDVLYPVHITRDCQRKGKVKMRTRDEIGDEFLFVPGGPFQYGEGEGTKELEVDDFAIQRYPVTFGEYGEFLDALEPKEAKARLPRTEGEGAFMERGGDGRHRTLANIVEGAARERCIKSHGEGFEAKIPVMAVTFEDAQAYCRWKTEVTRQVWRLPTEQEREKAARGADGRAFPWGNLEDASLAKCRDSFDEQAQPEPVGAFKTAESVYGMGDAAGSMWEWTDSWLDETESFRVLKGSAWFVVAAGMRLGRRAGDDPGGRFPYAGFRCVKELR
jgi:serine/threonine-protein kinase